jgi:DNA-binding MarR family transcriptional regulator
VSTTRYNGGVAAQASREERELWRAFFLMRRQLELTLERRLQADAGISSADYEILVSLAEEPTRRRRAGNIGDLIGWEKSRVSHQITRMEQRGLVKREECGDDARGVWVVLTEEGSRAVLGANPDRGEALRQYFFDVLSDDEKRVLTGISIRVLETIVPPSCAETGELAEDLDDAVSA